MSDETTTEYTPSPDDLKVATRGTEYARLEGVTPQRNCIIGVYDGDVCVQWVEVAAAESADELVAALPGEGWEPNPRCNDWLEWSRSQTGGLCVP